MEIKNMNCFKEEVEMEQKVVFSMINVITKGLPYAYIKMKKEVFLVDMHLYLGQEIMVPLQIQKVSYLL